MKAHTTLLRSIFGAFLILGGIAHLLKPELYDPMIPDALPKTAVNYLTGLIELTLGVGVFIPRYRSVATLGIFLLMIAFLPIHVIDAFRDEPAIGSKALAYVRLPLQFVLIGWAWFVYKRGS